MFLLLQQNNKHISKFVIQKQLVDNFRLNSSFRPLTFSKLRFWPPKKKSYKTPLSFALVAVLAPRPILTRSTLTWHPKWGATCYFLFFFWPRGAKTAAVAKPRGQFCSFFFLGAQNRNFVKVKGPKLLLSHNFNVPIR